MPSGLEKLAAKMAFTHISSKCRSLSFLSLSPHTACHFLASLPSLNFSYQISYMTAKAPPTPPPLTHVYLQQIFQEIGEKKLSVS